MPLPAILPAIGKLGVNALMAYMMYDMAKQFGILNKFGGEGRAFQSGMETMQPGMSNPFQVSAELTGMKSDVAGMERLGDISETTSDFRRQKAFIDRENLGTMLGGKQALLTRASALRPDMQQMIAQLVSSGAL